MVYVSISIRDSGKDEQTQITEIKRIRTSTLIRNRVIFLCFATN